MANVVTIELEDGTVTINDELLRGYLKEAFEHLATIDQAKSELKLIVEAVSDATKLKKPKVNKYFKQRYDAKTRETKELGDLFAKLDEVVK